MAFRRGDVVLLPFPYTNLNATKTRPAVVVSSELYRSARPELLLAYVSSQVDKVMPPLDYVLADWQTAGLLKPSFVRPKVAAIEPALIVHRIGKLSARDRQEVDSRLRKAMDLTASALGDVAEEIDFSTQSPEVVQFVAEKAVTALTVFAQEDSTLVDLDRIRGML
ncbi:MAG: type II toxin-antitoxin system PemK/MazF family toxin [Caldilineaceae bacterium]|nr:type II toxin-antitoxin system PemK/MazF family toxin [Caldilineaceae bacterium]